MSMGHIWLNNGILRLRIGKSRHFKTGEDCFSIFITVTNLTRNGLQGLHSMFNEHRSTLKVRVIDPIKLIDKIFTIDFLLFFFRGM